MQYFCTFFLRSPMQNLTLSFVRFVRFSLCPLQSVMTRAASWCFPARFLTILTNDNWKIRGVPSPFLTILTNDN